MKGLTIKEILRKNGITLISVAEKLGESSQNLSALLQKDDLRTSLVERISEVTGIPIAAFYGEAYSSATASGNSVAVSGDGNSVNAISERFMTLLENKDRQSKLIGSLVCSRRMLGYLQTKATNNNQISRIWISKTQSNRSASELKSSATTSRRRRRQRMH